MFHFASTRSLFKRAARVLLSLSLVLLLLPCAPYTNATAYADTLPGDYVEGELLVVYHSGSAKNNDGVATFSNAPDPLEAAGLTVAETWSMGSSSTQEESITTLNLEDSSGTASATPSSTNDVRVALVRSSDKNAAQLKQQVDALDCTVTTSPNYRVTPATTTPDDTLYDQQYNLNDAKGGINYETALSLDEQAGSSAGDNIIAVVDSGVDYTHPDLVNNMWVNPGNIGLEGTYGYDFGDMDDDPAPSTSTHGTHCAGIIAAQTNNAAGVAGTAQHTKIMALKQSRSAGGVDMTLASITASYNYISKAISAGQNVVGINNSYGLNQYSPVLDYCVNQVGKQGALSIFAAGNSAEDVEVSATYGATVQLDSPYAVMVASSNGQNQLAGYSNTNNTMVDIAAPGSRIVSSVATNDCAARASQEYSASLAAATGKDTITHYDGASLLNSGNWNWMLIHGTSLASEADKACFTLTEETYNGRPALKVSVDAAKLSDPLTNYVFKIERKATNPFAGVTADVSELRAGADVFLNTQETSYSETFALSAALAVSSTDADNEVMYVKSIVNDTVDFHAYQSTTPVLANSSSDDTWIGVTVQMGDTSGKAIDSASFYVTDVSFAYAANLNDYGYSSGTSMACPQVAGALAELASLYPTESALDLRGRLVGGTVPITESTKNTGHTATDGRFDFTVATDDDAINANSYGIVTNGNQITVEGYALDHATLTVDNMAIAPSSRTNTSITFTADDSLFDGAQHEFDLTDTASNRTHNASYAIPLGTDSNNPDTGTQSTLEKVSSLPVSDDVAARGCLVSSADTLFFADNAGEYLYSTSDPTGSWNKLSAPTLGPYEAAGPPTIVYQYLNNTLHAFYVDQGDYANKKTKPKIYHAAYNIAADSWRPFEMVSEVDKETSGDDMDYLCTAAQGNTVYCTYAQEKRTDRTPDAPLYTGYTWLVTGTDNGTQFTSAQLEHTNNQLGAVFGLNVIEGNLHAVVVNEQTNAVHDAIIDGTTATDKGAFSGCNLAREELRVMTHQTIAQTGAGILSMGRSYEGMGDTYLFDSANTRWESIGTLLGTTGDATKPSSAALFGGTMYMNAVDEVNLFTFSADAAAKLVDVDCTLNARATQGGSATVTDARNNPATTLVARCGDQATWMATPQDGYRFVGWFDEAGVLIAQTPALTDSSVTGATYTASFEPMENGGATTGTSDGTQKSTSAQTADNAPVVLLLAIATLAALTMRVIKRKSE